MIAAQTELQGLKQIYTDDNVRVRAAQARGGTAAPASDSIGGKLEGNGRSNLAEKAGSPRSMYPSIRKLPLLGVSYADLYRAQSAGSDL